MDFETHGWKFGALTEKGRDFIGCVWQDKKGQWRWKYQAHYQIHDTYETGRADSEKDAKQIVEALAHWNSQPIS